MYSSETPSINQKFTPASASATAPPLPPFGAAPAAGIPVSSANQTYNWTTPTYAPPPRPQAPVPLSSALCCAGGDITNFCITCWCPCITFGQITDNLDKGSPSGILNGAIYALLRHFTGLHPFYSCMYWSRMRHQYNLQGSSCGVALFIDAVSHVPCVKSTESSKSVDSTCS